MGCWVWLPPLRDWVTAPSRYRLISFISFLFHWESSTTGYLFGVRLWYAGTDNEIALYMLSHLGVFCCGKSTSGGGQACQSALQGGVRALGGRSRYREHHKTQSILSEEGWTRVRHRLPWCCHRCASYIGCDATGGVACEEQQNLQVCSWDTRTKNRHATPNAVGHYTLGNLQAMLLKPDCNAWSCHLHSERCITHSWCWDSVQRWEAQVPTGVSHSASYCGFAAAHQAASKEYFHSWFESVGERPSRRCVLRASGRSSMILGQLSYLQATQSCCRGKLGDVFHWTWRSQNPLYHPLWALTCHPLVRYYPRVSLLTSDSHHQSAECMSV